MSRSLTKSESGDGNEVAWYNDDKSFLMVVRYTPSDFLLDLSLGKAKYTGIRARKLGITQPSSRIDDVLIPPWDEEVFLQISSRVFGGPTVRQYVQRLLVPLRRGISVVDSTSMLTLSMPDSWLSRMHCRAQNRDFLLPYLDEHRHWVLIASSLYVDTRDSKPAYCLSDTEDLVSSGFWKEGRWWLSATANTTKGLRHRLYAEPSHLKFPTLCYELPVSWPRESRLMLHEDGTIFACREASGDRWAKVGQF